MNRTPTNTLDAIQRNIAQLELMAEGKLKATRAGSTSSHFWVAYLQAISTAFLAISSHLEPQLALQRLEDLYLRSEAFLAQSKRKHHWKGVCKAYKDCITIMKSEMNHG